MSNKKLYTASRWHDNPNAEVIGHETSNKEEQIENKKGLLEILVKDKIITKEEAEKRLNELIEKLNN